MISFSREKNFTKSEIAGLILIVSVYVFLQIYVVNKFSNFTLPILVLFCSVGLILIINKAYIQDIPTVLFVLFLTPFVYLNNLFHYDFRLELISSIPLIILILIAIASYIYYDNSHQTSDYYIRTPLILMVFYFSISGIISIVEGKSVLQVSYQIFQFLLFLMIFPLLYLMREKRLYLTVFYILLFITIISSIEYIIINSAVVGKRFVTFQSGFLPIATAILFSYFLYQKKSLNKIFALLLLAIVVTGSFMTLTRSLWFTTFLVILLVIIFNLIAKKRMTVLKFLFFMLIAIIPFFSIKDTGSETKHSSQNIESVEYRTKSVSDPLEDPSFLMRIELSYYAFERFSENFFLGSGLDDFLKYKIFVDTSLPIYYTDSTWIYLLWKGGIVGFVLFLWLYIRFFRASYFVIVNSSDTRAKYICLGLLAGFIGLSFLGLFSPLLIKYKTNALIVFFFAYVEFERNNILISKSESPSLIQNENSYSKLTES